MRPQLYAGYVLPDGCFDTDIILDKGFRRLIMHGPVGCGSQSHGIDFSIKQYGAARGVKMEGARWLSTNLTETDVISGGNEKLYDTIIEADRRFRPTAIFVCNTVPQELSEMI
ncbi:nitrogenase component 1 [Ruminococcus albus]|uniref:nitrogenase component 1 n=1 Tax=Ruminococcus albus TaxID=1264 RepID=UPI001D159E00|nr:nitrogenase component 1 [Ruminococcus albus]MCC3352869.1 nitrogenase component 1 [Ruminococcus albus 8]